MGDGNRIITGGGNSTVVCTGMDGGACGYIMGMRAPGLDEASLALARGGSDTVGLAKAAIGIGCSSSGPGVTHISSGKGVATIGGKATIVATGTGAGGFGYGIAMGTTRGPGPAPAPIPGPSLDSAALGVGGNSIERLRMGGCGRVLM